MCCIWYYSVALTKYLKETMHGIKDLGFLFVWFGLDFFCLLSTHHCEEDTAEFTAVGICGTGSSHHRGSGSRVTKVRWNFQSPLVTRIMQAPTS